MTKPKKQQNNIETIPDEDKTPEEKVEEKLDRVETLLEGLLPGHRLSIYRVRPSWCRSWLETIELGDEDGVDMDYLARTWGGEILRLRILDQHGKYKGQVDVPLMSYPPKVHGKPLSRSSLDSDFLTDAKPVAAPTTASVSRPENTLSTIIDVLSRTRKDDLSVLKSLLPSAAQETRRPLSELVELAETFGQLKTLFAADQASTPASATDSDTAFLGSIAEMVKTVFANKNSQQIQQSRIIGPGRSVPTPISQSIVSVLASLSPDAAAKTFFDALRSMNPEKAEATVKKVLATFQNDDIVENEEVEEDDESGEENE